MGLFDEGYSPTGKNLIEFGIIIVFIWMFIYIGLVLSPYAGKLYPTVPFLAFGVLLVLAGLGMKEHPKRKKKDYVSGIEELGLAVLAFEFIPAILFFAIFLTRFLVELNKGAILSLIFPIVISIGAFIAYWQKSRGQKTILVDYAKWILLFAILSHTLWVDLLTIATP